MTQKRTLEQDILQVFKRSCADERLDVAEHLLNALETLCGPAANPVKDAYRAIGHLGKPTSH